MSLKKIEQVKKDRGFKLFDVIIYGAVALLAASLFLAVFLTRNTDPLTGVRIYVNAEQVFEYEFGSTPIFSDELEIEETDTAITVRIVTDSGYNVVYIDKTAKSVIMKEADCRGKQCTYFPAMDDNSKFIYCSPHGVRIEPYTIDLESPDIIM